MRIVMVTDDVLIDRRILLEAESLIKRGHEVILLAAWGQGQPTHEMIGKIKVERIASFKHSSAMTVSIKVHAYLMGKLNAISTGIQNLHNWSFATLAKFCNAMSKFFNFCITAFSKRTQSSINSIIKGLRFLLKGPAFIVNTSNSKMYLLLNRRNHVYSLQERIAFFNPDIIHIHDLPQLKAGYGAKKQLKVPLIYDAHEIYPEIESLTLRQKIRLRRLERNTIRHCDEVIIPNEFSAICMAKSYRIPIPNVIYNAINPIMSSIGESEETDLFRKKLNLPPSTKILLYQGWMSKTRGIQALVAAMSLVDKDVHLVLMGYGEIHEELQEIIATHKLDSRVHILDAVPQAELMMWTRSADVGIIPYQPVDLNSYYCSPNKLFEFIQSGIPIIANDLPFLRKVIVENNFGMVAKMNSMETFASGINMIFSDQNALLTYKKSLTQRAHKFSWAVAEGKLFEVYQRVAGNHVF